MPPGSTRSAIESTPTSSGSPESRKSSEYGPLSSSVDQSAEQHLDLRVVVEDLGGRVGELGVQLGGEDPRLASRTPERSHAVPTPQPVPNSAIVPVRVAARAASSRPVSLRQNDT